MEEIFLSYAREDVIAAEALERELEDAGWSVFWDREIDGGADFEAVIEAKLKAAKCVIVLWSTHAQASKWVKAERNFAFDRDMLVPILIEDVEIPLAMSTVQVIQLQGYPADRSDVEWERMLAAIRQLTDREPPPSASTGSKPSERPGRRAWWVPVVTALVLLGVMLGVGAFVPLQRVDVRLDGVTTQLSFRLTESVTPLTSSLALDWLGAVGFGRVDVPRGVGGSEGVTEDALRLAVIEEAFSSRVSLDVGVLPVGTFVSLTADPQAGEHRMSLRADSPYDVTAFVTGLVRIDEPGGEVHEQHGFNSATPVTFIPRTDDWIDLDLSIVDVNEESAFRPELMIEGLDVTTAQIFRGDGGFDSVVNTALVSGTLVVPSLGVTLPFPDAAAGEVMRLDGSAGVLRTVTLREDGVSFVFEGEATDVLIDGATQMPTWLSWLRHAQGGLLLVGVLAGYAVLTAAVVIAWRRPRP